MGGQAGSSIRVMTQQVASTELKFYRVDAASERVKQAETSTLSSYARNIRTHTEKVVFNGAYTVLLNIT